MYFRSIYDDAIVDPPESLDDDQVIFVRGLRGKKRLIFKGFHKLVGEAEPRDPDEDPSDSQDTPELLVEALVGQERVRNSSSDMPSSFTHVAAS